MWRCSCCNEVVDGPQLRHVTYRDGAGGRQIAAEVPACKGCLKRLRAGASMSELRPASPRPPARVVERAVEPEYEGPRFPSLTEET
jgi:hypothetical protein